MSSEKRRKREVNQAKGTVAPAIGPLRRDDLKAEGKVDDAGESVEVAVARFFARLALRSQMSPPR